MLQTAIQNNESAYPAFRQLDDEGFLLDPAEWAPDFSALRAQELGITLIEKHWQLIELIRHKALDIGSLPPMRSVCRQVGLDRRAIKAQFGSCLNFWRMAGLPNPGEEAKAYMN